MQATTWTWLAVTVAALIGMFHLWYTREWKTYGSLEGSAITRAILTRLGMDPSLESVGQTIRTEWPPEIHYKFQGNPDHASYLHYLILPRLPCGNEMPRMSFGSNTFAGQAGHLLNAESQNDFKVYISTNQISNGSAQMLNNVGTRPILGILLFLCVSIGLGYGFARLLRFTSNTFPENALLGFALLSFLYLTSKSFFGQATFGMWTGITGGIFSAGYEVWRAYHPILNRFRRVQILTASRGNDRLLLSVIMVAIVWSFLMAVVTGPDEWDCWANWAAKAKLLFYGSDGLRDMTAFGPQDYPPFWPTLWSIAAWFCGGWEDRWVKGVGPIMLALCAWEMVAVSVRVTGGRRTGLIAAAILCSAPIAPLVASWGYAEPLLWLAICCVYGVALRPDQHGSASRNVMLALMVICCVMTKNEGAVAILSLAAWRLFRPDRTRWTEAALLIATTIVVRVAWTTWLHHGALAAMSGDIGISNQWRNISEWGKALFAAGHIYTDPRLWGASPILLFVILFTCFRGTYASRCTVLLPAILMLGSALLIIIMRPGDMNYKVGTAWSRLTLQALMPTLMLLIPLLQTPFQLIQQNKKG